MSWLGHVTKNTAFRFYRNRVFFFQKICETQNQTNASAIFSVSDKHTVMCNTITTNFLKNWIMVSSKSDQHQLHAQNLQIVQALYLVLQIYQQNQVQLHQHLSLLTFSIAIKVTLIRGVFSKINIIVWIKHKVNNLIHRWEILFAIFSYFVFSIPGKQEIISKCGFFADFANLIYFPFLQTISVLYITIRLYWNPRLCGWSRKMTYSNLLPW